MKLLFLCHNPETTGTYVRAYELARSLAKRGHDTTLIAVSQHRSLKREERQDGRLRLVFTPNILHDGFVLSRFTSCGGWGPLDILTRLREGTARHWDVIQTFDHFPNIAIPFGYLRRRTDAKFVSDWCDIFNLPGGFRDTLEYRLDAIYRKVAYPFEKYLAATEVGLRKQSDAVTTISHKLKQAAMAQGIPEDRITVVEGGADIEAVRPLDRNASRQELGLDPNHPIVMFLGRSQFDLDILIKSFARVRRAIPDAKLLVIGRNNFAWTRDLASGLGLADAYREVGYVPAGKLPLYLASADVLALPQKKNLMNETRWPNKIGEYMASGRPMVVSDVGDVADIVRREKIGLVADQDEAHFAEQIEMLLSRKELAEKLGGRARAFVCSALSWDLLAARLEGLYFSLMNEAPHAAA